MTEKDYSYKDLSQWELNKLKDLYVTSRLNKMTEDELRNFVKTIIDDQIKGTVGNEEEREAWKEMKDYFQDDFEAEIKKIKSKSEKTNGPLISPEEEERNRRLEMVEKLKEERKKADADMWEDE